MAIPSRVVQKGMNVTIQCKFVKDQVTFCLSNRSKIKVEKKANGRVANFNINPMEDDIQEYYCLTVHRTLENKVSYDNASTVLQLLII
ncbi:KL precursor, partial [Pelobates cultripes]